MTAGAPWLEVDDVHQSSRGLHDDGVEARPFNADNTDAIRADINETRARMSQTLDALGARLNPQTIKDNVKDSIREATIGRVSHMAQSAATSVTRSASGVADTIRENPIPAAMIAIGLGWMFFNGRSSSPDQHGSMDRIKEGVQDLTDSARDRAGQLADQARDTVDTAGHTARDLAGSVAHTTKRSAGRVEKAFYENPMALGAMSLAVGLAAGFSVPVSDREIRMMGDARDGVVDQIEEVADDLKEKARSVASRVMNETKTAVREEGLMS